MRTTDEKISLYTQLFTGRTDVYGTHDPVTGRGWQVKEPVTRSVIQSHLRGDRPYGVYLLQQDKTPAVVADFDNDGFDPVAAFVAAAAKLGISAYIETSKAKGFHAWVFFTRPGVSARKARTVMQLILRQIGQEQTEVFPKQDRLDSNTQYGNFINAPLFWGHMKRGRTVFIDQDRKPYPDQWAFLAAIQRVPEALLDQVIREHRPLGTRPEALPGVRRTPSPPLGTFGLRPCAQRMLAEGCTDNQRVACFRLAVQLRKAGLPLDSTVAVLRAWAKKNKPDNGKPIISPSEIRSQAKGAYRDRAYRACGCEEVAIKPFCDSACSLLRNDGKQADG